jgi:hypothetical protein
LKSGVKADQRSGSIATTRRVVLLLRLLDERRVWIFDEQPILHKRVGFLPHFTGAT